MTRDAELEAALSSSDPEERRRAVQSVLDAAPTARVPLLLRGLGDEDWRVRKEAVAVAVELGPTEELLAALVGAFGPGDDVGLRNAAVEALASFGTAAVSALSSAIGSLDADGRKLAAEALGRGHDPRALPVLERLLADPDANVRVAAVDHIAEIGSVALDAAARALRDALRGDDLHVRLAALDGSNRLGVVVPWDEVAELVDHPMLRRSALSAAARSGDARAAGALARALEDERRSVFALAVTGLAELALGGEVSATALRERIGTFGESARRRLLALVTEPGQPELRRAALVLAAVLGEAAAIDPALDALDDEQSSRAAEATLRIYGVQALPRLVERIGRGGAGVRAAAIALAVTLAPVEGDESVVGALREAIADDAPEVASAALAALATLGGPGDLVPLVARVASVEPRTSAAAEMALASLAARHPVAAKGLARRVAADPPSQAAAAVLIAALGGRVLGAIEDDVAFLAAVLSGPDARARRAAVVALGDLGAGAGLDAIAFALADEAREVQLAAVRALGKLRDGDGRAAGTELLVDIMHRTDDVELVGVAIRALGESADPAVVQVLAPLVRSPSAAVAVAAVDALGRSDDPARLLPLLEAAAATDVDVVKAALLALEGLAEPAVAARYGAALDHDAWDVRRLAADCLGRMHGASAADLLRGRLVREHEPLVREAIDRALLLLAAGSTVRRPATIAPPSES